MDKNINNMSGWEYQDYLLERVFNLAYGKGRITEEEYENHDCHLSPEDGCETCEKWYEQNNK